MRRGIQYIEIDGKNRQRACRVSAGRLLAGGLFAGVFTITGMAAPASAQSIPFRKLVESDTQSAWNSEPSPLSAEELPVVPETKQTRLAYDWLTGELKIAYFALERVFETELVDLPEIQLVPAEDISTVLGESAQALYADGIIYVAAAAPNLRNRRMLRRTIRHEAVHAAIAELTGATIDSVPCPAWIEEGLAQIYEGTAPQVTRVTVLTDDGPATTLPLSSLEDNLTELDPELIGLAYAQSRYAAQKLINSYGIKRIKRYFKLLRAGEDHPAAFSQAFNQSLDEFEQQLDNEFERTISAAESSL